MNDSGHTQLGEELGVGNTTAIPAEGAGITAAPPLLEAPYLIEDHTFQSLDNDNTQLGEALGAGITAAAPEDSKVVVGITATAPIDTQLGEALGAGITAAAP